MKNKNYICPECKGKCKYRGSRRFYCKACNKTFTVDRVVGVKKDREYGKWW